LTVSRPHIPIRDIDDLANQSDISYGTINGGSTMQFFQVKKIKIQKKKLKKRNQKLLLMPKCGQG